jgi:para-aminobenzoate synthetase component 1
MSQLSPARSNELVSAVHLRELPRVPDAVGLLDLLRGQGFPWLLDSASRDPRLGRFSFVGADPYLVVRVWGSEARLECRREVRRDLVPGRTDCVADPFALVRSLLPPAPAAGGLPVPFVGGAVGYFGYELASRIEAVSFTARDELGLPDLSLLFVDRLVAIDHLEDRAFSIGLGFAEDDVQAERNAGSACRAMACLAGGAPPLVHEDRSGSGAARLLAPAPRGLETFFQEDSYTDAVEEALQEIAAGNVYQANLTHRMDLAIPGADSLALYRELRELNPAPFAAYLELPEATILSSSPERFLRLDSACGVESACGVTSARRVESRPIKGTRPRGATRDEDVRLEEALRTSEKDRAENLMIVDLVRNDLGRVCETGSVAVPELMAVEAYATVFQMVSTVTGCLRSDRDAMDLVCACFPPGSMTGAPKLAAMKLIDRLEPVRRGIYSGGLGYLDVRGGLDLSVVIRTLIVTNECAHLHVGGGIVADSDPIAEYRETLDKAQALLAALARVARPAAREVTAAAVSS